MTVQDSFLTVFADNLTLKCPNYATLKLPNVIFESSTTGLHGSKVKKQYFISNTHLHITTFFSDSQKTRQMNQSL